jgi:hypothetical protein
LGEGLRTALLNYIEQAGLDLPVQHWFSHAVKAPRVPRSWAPSAIAAAPSIPLTAERRCVWIGSRPVVMPLGETKRRIILPTRVEDFSLTLSSAHAAWVMSLIHESMPSPHRPTHEYPRITDIRRHFPISGTRGFDRFSRTKAWHTIRQAGLLLV